MKADWLCPHCGATVEDQDVDGIGWCVKEARLVRRDGQPYVAGMRETAWSERAADEEAAQLENFG